MKFRLKSNKEDDEEMYKVVYIDESMVGGYNAEQCMKMVPHKKAEFIFERQYEEELMKTPCIFKIKKFPKSSYQMHHVLLKTIENVLSDNLNSLEVIEDTNAIRKKAILKTVIAIANGKPIRVDYSAGKFENLCDMKVSDISNKDIKKICKKKIEYLKSNIEKQNNEIYKLTEAINSLK